MAAFPDAVGENNVVEIKCPVSSKSQVNYIKTDGTPSDKAFCYIQLQLHVTGRKLGFYCVADPDFERNKKIKIFEVR